MNIPAITGISGLTAEHMNKPAEIDGEKGILYIEPDMNP